MDPHTKSKASVHMLMSVIAFGLALWMTRNTAETLAVEKQQDESYRIVDTRHFTKSKLRWTIFLSMLTLATKFFISTVGIVTAWRLITNHDKPLHIPHRYGLLLPIISVCLFLLAEYLLFYGKNDNTELDNKIEDNQKMFMLTLAAIVYVAALVTAGASALMTNLHGYC